MRQIAAALGAFARVAQCAVRRTTALSSFVFFRAAELFGLHHEVLMRALRPLEAQGRVRWARLTAGGGLT